MLSHIRVIGCLCYAKIINESDNLVSISKAAVPMGYSEVQKEYILLDLITKSFFVSRDVLFKDSIFPFNNLSTVNKKGLFIDDTGTVVAHDMVNIDLESVFN